MVARLFAVTAGIWLMAAPAVLDYQGPAADNDRTVGPIVACLAFVAIWDLTRPLRWLTLPLGIWLTVAPLALGYDDGVAAANSLAAGLAIALTAPYSGTVAHTYGGGWRSLARSRRGPRPSTPAVERPTRASG